LWIWCIIHICKDGCTLLIAKWTQWTRARINITALWCHTVKFLIYTSDQISNKIQILDIWKVNGMALVRNCIQHNPHIYTKWAPSTQCHVYNADCYTHTDTLKNETFSAIPFIHSDIEQMTSKNFLKCKSICFGSCLTGIYFQITPGYVRSQRLLVQKWI